MTLPFARALLALLAALIMFGAAEAASADARLRKPEVGKPPLSSKVAAARVHKTRWEPRPGNREANHTVPSRAQIKYFRANSDMPYARYVNGRYRGSTDDIIEWAAIKWGLAPKLLRAVAVHETWWDNSYVGDNGDSFGIFQVRRPYHCCLPFMRDSTAFNADYYGGIIRSYYDGLQTWLNNADVAVDNGRVYRAGDLWGSVGAWATGRWHADRNEEYVRDVRAEMRKRTWKTHPYFDE